MTYLRRRLQERVDQLPETEKLYATYAYFERLRDADIRGFLRLPRADSEHVRTSAVEHLGDLVPVTSRDMGTVRRAAEAALRDRLEALTGEPLDRADRLTSADHIVVGSIEGCARERAIADVRAGDGSELKQPKDSSLSPRFHSSRSSCALAVNAFGYWRCDPSTLRIARTGGFERLRFEAKFPIEGATRRVPPNLDAHMSGPTVAVAVESKLLEYLSPAKPVEIAGAYDRAIEKHAHPSWRDQIERLRRNPSEFQLFAAGQIIKHYLGIKSAGPAKTTLLYVYWEPSDADQCRVFAQHRTEVESFSNELSDPEIAFAALDYPSLLAEWDELGDHSISAHVRNVRDRYAVAILGDA